MNDASRKTSTEFLLAHYEVLLIDAFGVLMDTQGALPGAVAFINELNRSEKPYFILSNSSLYNAQQNQANYLRRGLEISKERIITSGALLPKWMRAQNLTGKRFLVLGPEPTKNLIRDGGGFITDDRAEDVDVIVLGHQSGFDFVDGMDHAITLVFRSIESGKALPVILPNPDVIYPKEKDCYGITAGSLGLILREAVNLRFPQSSFQINCLGKPYPALFEEARSRVPAQSRMVMIGDQLHTDIKGAQDFGIDSVLIGTGVTKIASSVFEGAIVPTYVMDTLLSIAAPEKA